MTNNSTSTAVCLYLALGVVGCTGAAPEEPISSSSSNAIASAHADSAVHTAQPGSKQIGDPCAPSDGWQPAPSPPEDVAIPDETPRFHKAPPGLDHLSLPPGVYYCSPYIASTAGSRGYWTMSCHTDADCPASTKCGNGISCVTICQSDAECPDWAPNCVGNPGSCTYLSPRL